TEEEIATFQQNVQPDTRIHLRLQQGEQLADLRDQDPYSYVLADMLIDAQSREELERKYREAADTLPFEFQPLEALPAGHQASATTSCDGVPGSH
ncbi:MAG TPA: hypothetical protein VLO13_08320, partial [Halomonas sp.]|nr:hypothetical protein [Halomonas sp.]